jgi:polyisoprenoid-binding protein YceI
MATRGRTVSDTLRKTFLLPILALVLAAAAALPAPAAAEPRRYVIDPAHTSIGFMVMHIGFARTLGIFREAEGSFVFDETVPAVQDIQATIKAASVFTNHDKRDDHIRNADFLDAAQHPTITFKGREAVKTGPRTGRITGDLSLRGVTRPVTLEVVWNRSGVYPFGDKQHVVGISARTTIKRSEFGMTYALAGDLVGDEVEIILEFEAIRQPA